MSKIYDIIFIGDDYAIRNGVQISTYRNILTKDRYNEMYNKNKNYN